MSEWINVADWLPESGRNVLCYSPYGEIFVGWYSYISRIWFKTGSWLEDRSDVSYWMPLPESPKEVQNEETNSARRR